MGLSRNKVAVPEGAAGTPPFWKYELSGETDAILFFNKERRRFGVRDQTDGCHSNRRASLQTAVMVHGGLAQLARALAWHARGHRFDSDILHSLSNGNALP